MSVLPENTLETPDGRILHCRMNGPADARRVIVVVHGLGEHSGWYSEFVTRMADQHTATLIYDQHGHGKSPGRRGDAPGMQTLLDDIAVALDRAIERWPDAEPLLLGHSLGGHLVLRYLLECRQPLRRAVVTNPMILPDNPPTKPQAFAAWLTAKCIPRFRLSTDIEPTELTQDRDILEELADDPLAHEKLSIGIGGTLMSSGHELLERADAIQAELLMLLGGDDTLCDRGSTKTFADRVPRCDKIVFERLKHNLLLEKARSDVYDQLINWLG